MVIHWFPHEIAYKCKGKCKVNNNRKCFLEDKNMMIDEQ